MRGYKKELETGVYEIIPITPIHIGSGTEILPYNYVIKNDIFYKIELSELFEKLNDNERDRFQKELLEGMVSFRSYINSIYKEEYGYIYKANVDEELLELYNSKLRGAKSANEENQLIVKEFIEGVQGKYIPGSAIKGAIRTAFLSEANKNIAYTLGRNKRTRTAPFCLMTDDEVPIKALNKAKSIEAGILEIKKLEPKIDPFKNLIVGDSSADTDLIEVIPVERVTRNQKQAMQVGNIEATKSILTSKEERGLRFRLSIRNFSTGMLKNSKLGESIVEEIDIYQDELFDRLRARAKKLIEDEKEFFKEAKSKMGESYCKEIEKIIANLNENETVIKLGFGSGFNAMTFNLVNKRFNKKGNTPMTKVVYNDCPMGWALIRKIEG